jgi:hypothetical protein
MVCVAPCTARVFTVDVNGGADYQTIQGAINASFDGDTVIVRPGLYVEQVFFNGRRITVRSESPNDSEIVEATTIASDADYGVVFDMGEDGQSVLTGLKVAGQGILCVGTSPAIVGNIIRDCAGSGIAGQNGAAPLIAGNTLVGNRVDDFGGGIASCGGVIRNNIIAGNWAGTQGGGLYECYGTIRNNTITGNIAGVAGGGLSRCPGPVSSNIIAFNEATIAGDIYGDCDTMYNVFWRNANRRYGENGILGTGDALIDPLFALEGYWNVGDIQDSEDDVWVDGDYHVMSEAGRWDPTGRDWVSDVETSPCVDGGDPSLDGAGEMWPHGRRINIGAYGGTARASLSASGTGHPADLTDDGLVGLLDLQHITDAWLGRTLPLVEDLNRDEIVNLVDMALLAQYWRTAPGTPSAPVPDPMTFEDQPYETSPYSIEMTATIATSTDGTGVEYFFENYFYPESNSGWVTFDTNETPYYGEADLLPDKVYWYRVKARNRGNRLETRWSERFSARTEREDSAAPTPNPMTWATEPYASAANAIRMIATEAVDESGVEYQFDCVSNSDYTSGWQDSTVYEVTDLPHGDYTFRVRARDKSVNQNTTMYSVTVTIDLQPPSPDPMEWEVPPEEIYGGGGTFDYYATMTAVEASDASGGVEYYFQCTSEGGFSSGWQTSREYTVLVGRRNQSHRFRVKARDISEAQNQTGWSSELPAR